MTEQFPKISIITVALNSASTIEDCLNSVKKQLFPVQQIIIDGNSTDNTFALAKKYAGPEDKLISEPDDGMYHALNKGLAIAGGDIIGILNADDFYPHNRVLSIVVEQLRNPEVDACYGDLVYVDRQDSTDVKRYWHSGNYNDKSFLNGWMPPHPTFFAKRRIYEKFGVFRLDMRSAADYEILLRFFVKHRIRVRYIPDILVVMRSGGMSNVRLRNRIQANVQDRRSWDVNRLKLKPWTTLFKPLMKLKQLFFKKIPNKPWLDEGWIHGFDGNDLNDQRQTHESLVEHDAEISQDVTGPSTLPFYVVTVNYKSDEHMKRLIQSLRPVNVLKKLIIVDHSSSGYMNSLSANFPIKVIRQKNRGYGAGINRGLRHVPDSDAVVLVCNPDIELLTPQEVVDAITYLEANQNVACLAPSIVNTDMQRIHSCRRFYSYKSIAMSRIGYARKKPTRFRRDHFYMDLDLSESFQVDWSSGSALFLRSSLFPYPLSFDERFFVYFEDVDLCAQIHRQGLSIVYYPKMVCIHKEQRESAQRARFLRMHIASLMKYIHKYHGLPQAVDLRPDMEPS